MNMPETVTVTGYLSQGLRLAEAIACQTERLKLLRESVDRVAALRVREAAVQGSPSGEAPFVRALRQIWDLQEAIDRDIELLVRLDRQIDRVIGTLLSPDYRILLRYRYLSRKTWRQIADRMHVDPSTAKRWHTKAVSLLTLPDDAIWLREETGKYIA